MKKIAMYVSKLPNFVLIPSAFAARLGMAAGLAATVTCAHAQSVNSDQFSVDCYNLDANRSIQFSNELSAINKKGGNLADKEVAAYRYYTGLKAFYQGQCSKAEQAPKRIADADSALGKLPAAAARK